MTRTITLAVAQDALVAQKNGATSYGAGKDQHITAGWFSGGGVTWKMRGLIGFEDLPAKLAAEGVTKVVAARLKAKTSAFDHMAVGSPGRTYLKRITAAWTAGGAGNDSSWSTSAAVEWSNQPATTDTNMTDKTWPGTTNTIVTADVMALMRAVIPATIQDDLGNPGGGAIFYGIALISFDEASNNKDVELYSMEGSYPPYLELDIEDNQSPVVSSLTPANAAVYVSSTGQTLAVTFGYSDPDGNAMASYQFRVWGSAITDAMIAAGTAGVPLYDSGSVNATSPPASVTATGLTRRSSVRPQVRVKDSKGSWGAYTTIDDRLVTLDAKPTPTNITITPGTRTPTWAVSISDPDTALGGTNGQMSAIEIDVWANTGLGRVYIWRSGKQAVALTQRGTLTWGAGDVTDDAQFGQTYGWHLRIWDDADQPSDFTADATWAPIQATGPEIMLPADTSTKIDTLTPAFTIGSTSGPFDQIEYRVFGDAARATPYYDSGVVAVGSTTVRATSNSGQAVLNVVSIAGVTAGDTIRINHGGGSQEDKIVLSTNAVGPTITCTTNLASTHNVGETIGTMQTVRTYPATNPPARALQWGEAPFWDAARRPVGSTALDPVSDLRQFRLNSLPAKPTLSVITAGTVVKADGTIVVPSRNPTVRLPYSDVDTALYGEAPTRKVIEIRQAATPKGSGALVETRTSTSQLLDDAMIGELIDLLDATAGWTASVGAVAAVATNPTGYGGTSLQYSPGALVNPATGMISKALDANVAARLLSSYSGGAIFRVNLRSSNITALDVRLRFSKAGGGAWTADYSLTIPGAINTYAEAANITRGTAPTASTGTPWSSAPDTVAFIVRPTAGTQTYVVLFRDLRVGTTQTAKTVPDGHLALESSYDMRGQWGDAAAPAVLGPMSDWKTVKVSAPPTVTLTSPADAAAVTDPTPALTWTKASPGGKSTQSRYAVLYKRVAGQDAEIWRSAFLDTAVTVTVPAYLLEHGATYAWEVDVIDSDGLVTLSSRRTFTTNFSKPATLTGLVLTPDTDRPRITVAWDASADPNAYEYVITRRRGNGAFERIDANGDPWEDGVSARITALSIVDFAPGLNVSVDYQVQVSNGSLDVAHGLSDPLEDQTTEALDGWWYQVPGAENYTLELHYVTDWNEDKDIQELVRQPLPNEDGQETRPILQTGALQGSRVNLTMDVGLEDADQLRVLREASTAAFTHGWLMSPLGDVWGAKPRAIPQRKGGGAGRRQLAVPFLQVK